MTDQQLHALAQALSKQRIASSCSDDAELRIPDRRSVNLLCDQLLDLLFPGFFSDSAVTTDVTVALHGIQQHTNYLVAGARRFDCMQQQSAIPDSLISDVAAQTADFLEALPSIAELVSTDIQAAFDNDPAAKCHEEIVAAYPGIQAIAIQRLAHHLYQLKVPLVPRMMTEVAHSATGIDIHPGARIGRRFAIDHGTGIVIGETTTIGDDCMLYHGVTLGAFNPLGTRNEEGDLVRGPDNKRHPDLEDHVTVYPSATILGGETVVGHHSVIGGNVWLTHSVVPWSRVTINDPDLLVRNRNRQQASDFTI